MNQALKRDRPAAPVLPNGPPLSVRMAKGWPCCRNKRTKACCTGRNCGPASIWASKPNRLARSRTVSGSTRRPSVVVNQPLKSAVHTSLGRAAGRARRVRTTGPRKRRRRAAFSAPRRDAAAVGFQSVAPTMPRAYADDDGPSATVLGAQLGHRADSAAAIYNPFAGSDAKSDTIAP